MQSLEMRTLHLRDGNCFNSLCRNLLKDDRELLLLTGGTEVIFCIYAAPAGSNVVNDECGV